MFSQIIHREYFVLFSGDKAELPEKLPPLENIKTLLRMKYYRHSWDALKDIHDLAANYLCNINIMLNFNERTEEVRFEAEKRETIYYSVMELLNKFESTVTNSEEVGDIIGSVRSSRSSNLCPFVRSFVQFKLLSSSQSSSDRSGPDLSSMSILCRTGRAYNTSSCWE